MRPSVRRGQQGGADSLLRGAGAAQEDQVHVRVSDAVIRHAAVSNELEKLHAPFRVRIRGYSIA